MSRAAQESGLAGLIFGERWQVAAGRALAVFIVAYVLPLALMAPTSSFAAFLEWVATVLSFVLTTGAIYKFLQARTDDAWVEEQEPLTRTGMPTTVAITATTPLVVDAVDEPVEPVPPPALETLGQVALERLCMALYQFNGLHSKAIATGAEGEYRIRLVPRNTDKAIAILQCRAGGTPQGVEVYAALLRVMEEDGLEKAFFVAPAGFAEGVAADARARHVTLVDLKLLWAMINRLPEGARETVFAAAV